MTETMTNSLHMVQLWLDLRRMTELARMLHLPLHRVDENYITHCALGELFGDEAPQPFCIEQTGGKHLRVLGYSEAGGDELQSTAQLSASPTVYDIPDWDRTAAKPMPDSFPRGMELGFEVRACPVIRRSSSGKEVDAFLARVWEVDDPDVPIDREDVYRDWLLDQFDRRGGARPDEDSISLEQFSLERMLRRQQGGDRTATTIKRPVATLAGTLQVTDGAAFTELLRSGIGRHRSFGFGMVKVRRA